MKGKGKRLLGLGEEELEEENVRMQGGHHGGGRNYWWVVTRTKPTARYPDGQVVLRGAFTSEMDAENEGERIGREYQVVQLATRDTARATQMWRERRLQKGDNLEEAMERQRHAGQEFEG